MQRDIMKLLPLTDIVELASILTDKGMSESEAIEQISEMLDRMLAFDKIIPNKEIGAAVEAIDDKLIATIIRIAVAISKAQKFFKFNKKGRR